MVGEGEAYTYASAVAETLPNVQLISPADCDPLKWSDLVKEKRELWPIQFLLPGGAYIH